VHLLWPGPGCTANITNTPHNTAEACAIVENAIGLVEGRQVDLVAMLFRSIWGGEPGRLPYFIRPSFHGEIACCSRPRWIAGTTGSPMHIYTWFVWMKTPRSGPSLKVRIGRPETTPGTPDAAATYRVRAGNGTTDARSS
jgi:hypothetical protein